MSGLKIGIVHPGEMGTLVAETIRNSGHTVYWVSEGRSRQTGLRAEECGLLDAETLERFCDVCSAIISVCPPPMLPKWLPVRLQTVVSRGSISMPMQYPPKGPLKRFLIEDEKKVK